MGEPPVELVSDEVERCDSYEDQNALSKRSTSRPVTLFDYLGLAEDDIPSLVIFSLDDRRLFVFRYGGDADDAPYQLFKNIAIRRPRDGEPGWLASAVVAVARDLEFAEGEAPVLAPPSLAKLEKRCVTCRGTLAYSRWNPRVAEARATAGGPAGGGGQVYAALVTSRMVEEDKRGSSLQARGLAW